MKYPQGVGFIYRPQSHTAPTPNRRFAVRHREDLDADEIYCDGELLITLSWADMQSFLGALAHAGVGHVDTWEVVPGRLRGADA